MKGLIEKVKRFNDEVTFSYDKFTRKVTVHLQNNAELFFDNIGFLLVFSPEEITMKPVLSGHRIKRTLSIKRTVTEVPKFISLIYFK